MHIFVQLFLTDNEMTFLFEPKAAALCLQPHCQMTQSLNLCQCAPSMLLLKVISKLITRYLGRAQLQGVGEEDRRGTSHREVQTPQDYRQGKLCQGQACQTHPHR